MRSGKISYSFLEWNNRIKKVFKEVTFTSQSLHYTNFTMETLHLLTRLVQSSYPQSNIYVSRHHIFLGKQVYICMERYTYKIFQNVVFMAKREQTCLDQAQVVFVFLDVLYLICQQNNKWVKIVANWVGDIINKIGRFMVEIFELANRTC